VKSFALLWLFTLHLHAGEQETAASADLLKTAAEAAETAASADLLRMAAEAAETAASADLLKIAAEAGLQDDFAVFPFLALLGRSGKSAVDGTGGDGTLWLSWLFSSSSYRLWNMLAVFITFHFVTRGALIPDVALCACS